MRSLIKYKTITNIGHSLRYVNKIYSYVNMLMFQVITLVITRFSGRIDVKHIHAITLQEKQVSYCGEKCYCTQMS